MTLERPNLTQERSSATEPRYNSYEEWLEHNPLDPEIGNLVTCPGDLTPALTTLEAARHREHLLMETGNVQGVALARETAKTVGPRNTLEQMLVEQLASSRSARVGKRS